MADRELLALAAKAAGYVLDGHTQKPWAFTLGGREWNPLTDDGDALRLAVKLRIEVQWDEKEVVAICYYAGTGHDGPPAASQSYFVSDPYAASRRAIVRAAAAMTRPFNPPAPEGE